MIHKKFEILLDFDLFGVNPSLYFKGKTKFGTKFGLFLTTLLLSFTSFCFAFFGQDLYFRLNPLIMYNEIYNPFPEGISIDPEINPILIELNSIMPIQYYSDPKIINMNVSQVTINQTKNGTKMTSENFRMETCRRDHFDKLDEKTKKYFLNLDLNSFFCIPKEIKNLTILGAFDQSVFKTVKFTASICSNSSYNNDCLTPQEIKNSVARGFIGIYFVDYNINPGNYENFYETQPKEVFTNFMVESQKEIDIFMRNNYIETDDGLIIEDVKQERVVNYDSHTEMDFKVADPDFLSIYLKIKQKNAYYKRKYCKIQESLADIGGFINCFWILLFGINYMHSHLVVIWEIIVDTFTIQFLNERNNFSKIAPAKKEPDKSNNGSTFSSKVQELIINDSKNSYSRRLNDLDSKKRVNFFEKIDPKEGKISPKTPRQIWYYYDNLKMSFLDYVYYYTGRFKSPEREQKKIVIQEGEKILQKCLDIKYIVSKFYEIEKLKQVLLSRDELKKFSHLPKPEIKIDLNKLKGNRSIITTLVGRAALVERDFLSPLNKMNRVNT